MAAQGRFGAAPRGTDHGTTRVARARRPVRSVATAVLFSLVVPLAAFAPAAQAEVLISNLDQSDDGNLTVGTPGSNNFTQALGFRTGAHSGGYRLTSVRAKFHSASSAVRVRIFSSSGSNPGSSVYRLTNPSSLGSGTLTFTAPANAEPLDPSTLYFILFDSTSTSSGYYIDSTSSDALTGTPASGWTLNNDRHQRLGTAIWATQNAKPLVEINGNEANDPNAMGKPAITGTAQVGQTLTANVGTITDNDGLPSWPSGFTFQWVQVDGMTETNVGTDSATYTPVGTDIGKKIKVKVTFTDDSGTAEGPLESDPTANVAAAPPPPCPSDADWCTTLTVGVAGPSMGITYYGFITTFGSLDDDTLVHGGTTYNFVSLYFADASGGTSGDFVSLSHGTGTLPNGTIFNLNGIEFTISPEVSTGFGSYIWSYPAGFDWDDGQKVRVGVKFPPPSNAMGKPAITGTAQQGETLTATIGTITDDDGLPGFPSEFTFQWVQVDGMTETNVGTDSATYTPVGTDIGKKIKVKVTFTDNDGNPEGPLGSDPTANVAAAPPPPCPSDADWCTTLTVGVAGPSMGITYYGFITTFGSLDDDTLVHGGTTYNFVSLYFADASGGTSGDFVSLSHGTGTLPNGTIFNLNGIEFTISPEVSTGFGSYIWSYPAGFDWDDGQQVTVGVDLPASAPNASGKPAITGAAQQGETLTATIGTITDDDGLPGFPSEFTFRWVRVDGSTETAISGARSHTYRPKADDIGKQIKVRVSFTDNHGHSEGPIESDATSDTVIAARPACPSDADWCAVMTAGRSGDSSGFSSSLGSLSDTTIEFGGETWTLEEAAIHRGGSTDTVAAQFDKFLPRGSWIKLDTLQLDADSSTETTTEGKYNAHYGEQNLGWRDGQKVTVSVRFPARRSHHRGIRRRRHLRAR